jgi:hypothetical protein
MQQFIKSAVIISMLSIIACGSAKSVSADEGKDICETLPNSIMCEKKRSQERDRIESQKRQQEFQEARQKKKEQEFQQYLLGIKEKYGYDPLLYTLKTNLFGNTLTIFSRAGWVRMNIDSENGNVDAFYTEADRNFWSGATDWHDQKTVNLSFTLDEKACQKFSAGKNCTFSGTDKVNLGPFFKEHELVKYGNWVITYLDNSNKRNVEFRIPLDQKPVHSKDGFNAKELRMTSCTNFPDSIACLYLGNK